MTESHETPAFDRWQITDAAHITLESPITTIGSGHLESYLEDPENAFGGLGIAIKAALPETVIKAFYDGEQRKEKLQVTVLKDGAGHPFVLVNNPEGGCYPWRLVNE